MNRTRQELFDKNWEHFIVNRMPRAVCAAKDGGTLCRYQVSETDLRRCAIGILVPDDQISQWKDLDGGIYRIDNETIWRAFGKDIVADDLRFLEDLQMAHDSADGISTHETLLLSVAKNWKLITPPVLP